MAESGKTVKRRTLDLGMTTTPAKDHGAASTTAPGTGKRTKRASLGFDRDDRVRVIGRRTGRYYAHTGTVIEPNNYGEVGVRFAEWHDRQVWFNSDEIEKVPAHE